MALLMTVYGQSTAVGTWLEELRKRATRPADAFRDLWYTGIRSAYIRQYRTLLQAGCTSPADWETLAQTTDALRAERELPHDALACTQAALKACRLIGQLPQLQETVTIQQAREAIFTLHNLILINDKPLSSNHLVVLMDQGGQLYASLTLPATDKSAKYTLKFEATYGSLSLPDLVQSVTIKYENSAPTLSGKDPASLTQAVSIDDSPDNYQGEELKIGNIASYFTDKETPDTLTYILHISGGATCQINGDMKVYPTDASTTDIVQLTKLAKGSCTLDLTLLSPGTLTLSVIASDGEFMSTDGDNGLSGKLSWTVTVESSYDRKMLTIKLTALAVLVALVLVLVIRYLCLPVFGDVCVILADVASDGDAFAHANAAPVPLSYYRKKSVSLLTLMLMFQLAPRPGLDAATADSILLYPARRRKGMDAFAAVRFRKQLPERDISLDGSVSLQRKKRYRAQHRRLLITVHAPEGTGSVCLYFSRQGQGNSFSS